jgi:hypothetical protein
MNACKIDRLIILKNNIINMKWHLRGSSLTGNNILNIYELAVLGDKVGIYIYVWENDCALSNKLESDQIGIQWSCQLAKVFHVD